MILLYLLVHPDGNSLGTLTAILSIEEIFHFSLQKFAAFLKVFTMPKDPKLGKCKSDESLMNNVVKILSFIDGILDFS